MLLTFLLLLISIGGPDKIVLVFFILLPLNKFLQGSSSTYFKNLSFYPILLKLKYLSLFQNSALAGNFLKNNHTTQNSFKFPGKPSSYLGFSN